MFNLTFTEQELNLVFNSLMQRPYGEVAQIVAKIQGEVQKQMKPQGEPNA